MNLRQIISTFFIFVLLTSQSLASKLEGGCAAILALMKAPGAQPKIAWVWRVGALDPKVKYRVLLTFFDLGGRETELNIRDRGRDVFIQVARRTPGVAGVSMHTDGASGFWTLSV